MKIKPNSNVMNWLQGIDSELLYISVLTIGEIKKGIEKLRNEKDFKVSGLEVINPFSYSRAMNSLLLKL